jgi:HEPN domain-containing protein
MKYEQDRWIRQAQNDLISAKSNHKLGAYNWVCFMCQQSGEKILTAFLYGKGAEDVWGHSLADLCEDAINFDPTFEMIKSVAVLLDKYYYLTRYPSQIPSGISSDIFAAHESEKAIEIAEEVIKFVIDRIDNI